jgi:hypothetical protein
LTLAKLLKLLVDQLIILNLAILALASYGSTEFEHSGFVILRSRVRIWPLPGDKMERNMFVSIENRMPISKLPQLEVKNILFVCESSLRGSYSQCFIFFLTYGIGPVS